MRKFSLIGRIFIVRVCVHKFTSILSNEFTRQRYFCTHNSLPIIIVVVLKFPPIIFPSSSHHLTQFDQRSRAKQKSDAELSVELLPKTLKSFCAILSLCGIFFDTKRKIRKKRFYNIFPLALSVTLLCDIFMFVKTKIKKTFGEQKNNKIKKYLTNLQLKREGE